MTHSATPSRNLTPARASAFTLLELVVVLMIVMIALAVILPVLSRAKSAARKSICMSNLHQNGLGMFTYLNDNTQRFPPFFFDIRIRNNDPRYQVKIKKKSKKDAGITVFNGSDLICPEDDPPDVLEVNPPGNPSLTFYIQMSYGFNIEYLVSDSPYDLISKPAKHVTLYDGSMSTNTPHGNARKDVAGNYYNTLEFAQFAMTPRHLNSANAAFADAHVASVSILTDENVSIEPPVALIDSSLLTLFN